MTVADVNMYLGAPGRLEQVAIPKGALDHTRTRHADVYALGNGGYRVGKLLGGARRYTVGYQRLPYDEFKKLEAYEQGHRGPGPFVLLDPGIRNILTVNQSSATSERNNTDGFTLAATGSSLDSSSSYYRRGPRSLEWTFSQASTGLVLDGSANAYATTPDAAALDITGDIDVRVDAVLADWTAEQVLSAKYTTTGSQRSWRFLTELTGLLTFSWSTDGSSGAVLSMSSTVAPTPDSSGRLAVRATLDVDNGAAGRTATFYTAPTIDGPWTQLGATVTTAGTTSIFSSTSAAFVGSIPSLSQYTIGTFYAAEICSGIGGTEVANPNFANQAPGTTSFADDAGRTWTLSGTAAIVDLGHAVSLDTPAPEWSGFPVHVGRSMVLSAYVKGGGTDGVVSVSATMRWLSEYGTTLSSNTGSIVVTDASTWQQVLIAQTPPASAAYVVPIFNAASGASIGSILYYDEMMLHEGTEVDSSWSPGGGILPVVPLSLSDAWPFAAGLYRERPTFVLQEVGGGG